MWIAEESLCAPLPAFWEDHVDDQVRQRLILPLVAASLSRARAQGNVYYRNRRTGQTSRYHPLDKKYKKKVLQAKMGDLQNKLGEIDPERERSSISDQPAGLQQQYYQKILPQGAGQSAQAPEQQQREQRDDGKRGGKQGFFTSLKRFVPSKKDSVVASNDELNQTLQLLETIDRRTKTRDQESSGAPRAEPAARKPELTSAAEPTALSQPAAARSGEGPVRKSRSRASFQLQSTAPVSKPAGLPADPHDGGPHEDVKDMATYLRLDPQRDYRFMWVSQVRPSAPHCCISRATDDKRECSSR